MSGACGSVNAHGHSRARIATERGHEIQHCVKIDSFFVITVDINVTRVMVWLINFFSCMSIFKKTFIVVVQGRLTSVR